MDPSSYCFALAEKPWISPLKNEEHQPHPHGIHSDLLPIQLSFFLKERIETIIDVKIKGIVSKSKGGTKPEAIEFGHICLSDPVPRLFKPGLELVYIPQLQTGIDPPELM